MTLDQVVTSSIYLLSVFVLFVIGKLVYDRANRQFDLNEQLVKKDNFAVALAVTGYYFGLVLAIGGVLEGPAKYWVDDVLDILFYGLAAIVLLNFSAFVNDRLILHKFNNIKELVDDRNAGTGAVVAGNHIAVGLVIAGAVSGEGGDLMTAAAFWIFGQVVLVLASVVYNLITPFDVHDEIEKDNVAVGVAFAGMLIGIGNVIRVGLAGDFVSWSENLTQFGGFVLFGLILLPVIRLATDKILLPGEKLSNELAGQEKPNIGAGVLEAFAYIAGSMILAWVV